MFLFADDLTLSASTVIGLQYDINARLAAAKTFCFTVILEKSKVIVLRKGGILAAREKWVFGENQLEVVNS